MAEGSAGSSSSDGTTGAVSETGVFAGAGTADGTVWEGRNEYFPLLYIVLASWFITGRQS